MCFSASIPNSTIAAVCAPRSLLSTKCSQFTLMRSSIGVISFSSNSRNVSRLSKNGSSNCLDGRPCIPNASFSKNSLSPEKYIFAYHIALTSNMD